MVRAVIRCRPFYTPPIANNNNHYLDANVFRVALLGEIQVLGQVDYGGLIGAISRAGKLATLTQAPIPRHSPRTTRLFQLRMQMKSNANATQRIQWCSINKSLRYSLERDAEDRCTRMVQNAIENGRSYKKALNEQRVKKGRIGKIEDTHGNVVSTGKEIELVFQNFYNSLYEGDGGAGFRLESCKRMFERLTIARISLNRFTIVRTIAPTGPIVRLTDHSRMFSLSTEIL